MPEAIAETIAPKTTAVQPPAALQSQHVGDVPPVSYGRQ